MPQDNYEIAIYFDVHEEFLTANLCWQYNFYSVVDVTWYLAKKSLLFYYDSDEQYHKHRNPVYK